MVVHLPRFGVRGLFKHTYTILEGAPVGTWESEMDIRKGGEGRWSKHRFHL